MRWLRVMLVILRLMVVAVLAVIVVGLVIQFCERIFIRGLSVCATLSGLVAVVTFTF